MSIPGINLLNIAAGVIAQQNVMYRQWLSRTRTNAGQMVDVYADAVPIRGSWQPANLTLIKNLGLDMQKQYRQLWTNVAIQPVDTNRGADKIIAEGYEWVPSSSGNDWSSVDGWRALIFVRQGVAT